MEQNILRKGSPQLKRKPEAAIRIMTEIIKRLEESADDWIVIRDLLRDKGQCLFIIIF